MRHSPIRILHEQAQAPLAHYGEPAADILVAETLGELELEYAALRKSCVLLDRPERGVIEITGADRVDFLNRMVTQELKGLSAGRIARTFWLNRKGRIDADLTLIEMGDRMLVDVDVLAAERAVQGLGAFVITEDVSIRDASESCHRLSLHGPSGAALMDAASDAPTAIKTLANDAAARVTMAGHEVVVFRDDSAGEIGLELIVPAQAALAIYQRLCQIGMDQHGTSPPDGPRLGEEGGGLAMHARRRDAAFRLRPAGWHAYNIARIEAGRALYNLDFGPNSLPHETGDETIRDRVSFTKGCYLGQEVVARMHSRGHSKQRLVALKCESRTMPTDDPALAGQPLLPVTGSHAIRAGTPDEVVGAVTSSTLSPMLAQSPICFATLKPEAATNGTKLLVEAEGQRLEATVQDSLRFWGRP